MKQFIVITTIQPPTKATLAFCEHSDWNLIIVGDIKTPHEAYQALERRHVNVQYLTPEDQERRYKKISDVIGWKSIQRRNIGFLEAYRQGADILATTDDDNIPYAHWGKNLLVNREIEVDLYEPDGPVFDPLSVTKSSHLWHRGFPIQLLPDRLKVKKIGTAKRKVLVQADLWNGDPDIDAIARLTWHPEVNFQEITHPYASTKIAPFNSQNTFLAREAIPRYPILPFVGRMDDIWGGYILQYYFPNSLVFNTPSVYQERNPQDLITNLEKEIIGYRNTLSFIANLPNYRSFLPEETKIFYDLYLQEFKKIS